MRTVDVTIAGVVYSMPVSFAASMRFNESVGDPFQLAGNLSSGKMLTMPQTVATIIAGVRSAGCQLKDEEIGEAIVSAGAQDYLLIAARYVVALVSGGPEKPIVADSKKKGRNRASQVD